MSKPGMHNREPGRTDLGYSDEELLAQTNSAYKHLRTILDSAYPTTGELRRWFITWSPLITKVIARRLEEGQTPEEASATYRKRLTKEKDSGKMLIF